MVRPRVRVIGWYGHGNCGDESYRLAFPLVFPHCDFHFDDSPADALVLGGGNVVDDHFLDRALQFHGARHLMSVSLTPDAPLDRLRAFASIVVRDQSSAQLLQQHRIPHRFAPDFAFALTPNAGAGLSFLQRRFQEEKHDLYERKVAVVLNSFLQSPRVREHNHLEEVLWTIARLCDATCASFVFLPLGTQLPHDDRVLNGLAASRCKWWKKNLVLYDRLDVPTTLNVLAACDLVLSTRLHATIFSVLSGRPFVDLTHHDKNLYFLRSIYRENWSVSYWDLSYGRLTELVQGLLLSSDPGLHQVVTEYKQVLGDLPIHVPLV